MLAQVRDLCALGRVILEDIVKRKNESLDRDNSIRIGMCAAEACWASYFKAPTVA